MAITRSFTVADLYAMPESERGERYELIDGVLFVTPPATWRHQTVSGNVMRMCNVHIRASRLGWLVSTVGIHVSNSTYVIPDLVFVSRERQSIIGEANLQAAPDLVVEILSPGTRSNDQVLKRALYARIGVREYWLIEPATQTATVLALESETYFEVRQMEAGAVTSNVLPGLRLTLDAVFEDVKIVPHGETTA